MENTTAVKPLKLEPVERAVNSPEVKLTASQKQRLAYLKGIYTDDEGVVELITLLEPRGENSWKKVNDKITSISQDDYKMQQYTDSIYDYFELGVVYSSDDIVTAIGDVRRSLNL